MDQFEQFLCPPHRPPGRHRVERIGRYEVCPRRRQLAKMTRFIMEPCPVLAPVLPALDQIELASEQRVMRMRYTKRSSFNVRLRRS